MIEKACTYTFAHMELYIINITEYSFVFVELCMLTNS